MSDKSETFIIRQGEAKQHEEKFTSLEEKKADAMEVAAQAYQERAQKAPCQSSCKVSLSRSCKP
jgi:hypothetical protein